MDNKKIGVIVIIIASLMWALEPILAKLAYQDSTFIQTSAVRAIVVALVALIYALVKKADFKITKKQIPKIVYLALAGTVFADLLYFYSLTKISVINAVLIGHMQPIFMVIIGYFFLKADKLNKYDYIGISIMIVAGLFVTTKNLTNLSALRLGTTADLLVLLATFTWATTAIVMRRYLRKVHSGVIVSYRFAIAAVVFLAYLLFTSNLMWPNKYQIILGMLVGCGSILYYEGLKRIKAAQVSALELSTPFFAVILGFFVLGEKVTIMQVCGVMLLVFGIYFLSRKES